MSEYYLAIQSYICHGGKPLKTKVKDYMIYDKIQVIDGTFLVKIGDINSVSDYDVYYVLKEEENLVLFIKIW